MDYLEENFERRYPENERKNERERLKKTIQCGSPAAQIKQIYEFLSQKNEVARREGYKLLANDEFEREILGDEQYAAIVKRCENAPNSNLTMTAKNYADTLVARTGGKMTRKTKWRELTAKTRQKPAGRVKFAQTPARPRKSSQSRATITTALRHDFAHNFAQCATITPLQPRNLPRRPRPNTTQSSPPHFSPQPNHHQRKTTLPTSASLVKIQPRFLKLF